MKELVAWALMIAYLGFAEVSTGPVDVRVLGTSQKDLERDLFSLINIFPSAALFISKGQKNNCADSQ